jgi:hypothetical protein
MNKLLFQEGNSWLDYLDNPTKRIQLFKKRPNLVGARWFFIEEKMRPNTHSRFESMEVPTRVGVGGAYP